MSIIWIIIIDGIMCILHEIFISATFNIFNLYFNTEAPADATGHFDYIFLLKI